jgi:UDP-2,3-diacylglucosamine pyrophosphatase LpxH
MQQQEPPIAVIADAHIGGPGGPAEPLVKQIEDLASRPAGYLLLLGDLFHVWVGQRKYETTEVRQVVGALSDLRAAGWKIDYIEGNRDFFIGEGPYAQLFDTVSTEVSFRSGQHSYIAVHGDGLNEQDRLYRFWHWLSKSAPSRFFMRHLPGAVARRLVGVTEGQLSKTNFKHKSQIPRDVISSYAVRRFAQGYDVLLLGHFHEARSWYVDGGEVRLLDAWFNTRRLDWLSREA